MPQTKPKVDLQWEIHIPPEIAVSTDKDTKAKSVAFPINFPDGYNGYLIVVKGVKWGWMPHDDISTIVINFRP